jgi:LEA14-like dessication related protein
VTKRLFSLLAVTFVTFLTFATACSEPLRAPTLKPEQITTSKISPAGADIEVAIEGSNPNKAQLSATSVQTKLNIGGKADAAKVTLTNTVVLPPNQPVHLKLPIKVEWTDAAAIKELAASKSPVDFLVEGSAVFSDGRASITAPFQVKGTMTASDLAQAAGGGK